MIDKCASAFINDGSRIFPSKWKCATSLFLGLNEKKNTFFSYTRRYIVRMYIFCADMKMLRSAGIFREIPCRFPLGCFAFSTNKKGSVFYIRFFFISTVLSILISFDKLSRCCMIRFVYVWFFIYLNNTSNNQIVL